MSNADEPEAPSGTPQTSSTPNASNTLNAPAASGAHPEEESERGTAVLGLLFLAALAGMWAVIYFLMLGRGA